MSLNDDEGGRCGHELSTSTNENSSAFGLKHYSSAALSICDLINCALEQVTRLGLSARVVSASINEVG